MRRIKRHCLLVLISLFSVNGYAQNYMYVYQNDGKRVIFPVSTVDSIAFNPVNEDSIITPQIRTLYSENGPYYTVTLSGQMRGLDQVALDFQCGFEYSVSDSFSKDSTVRKSATSSYSEEPFSITLLDIIPGQKYYYRAYYINQLYIYYGDTKEFATDEWSGPQAVDLGLSVKWATCNVGAYRHWEKGNYYAWGEVEPKETYKWNSYKYYAEGISRLTKYCNDSIYGYEGFTDSLTVLEPDDDVARVKWGGDWRIPSQDDITELIDSCTWTYTTEHGVTGYRVQSKKNDNSIFLPDSGDSWGSQGGAYWTNSIQLDCAAAAPFLYFNKQRNTICITTYTREYGLTIRPVCP